MRSESSVSTQLPKFDAPPVVEVALSLQFDALPSLSAAHIGWYWKECLGASWPSVSQAHPIKDVFEKFGEEREWGKQGILIEQGPDSLRLQFIEASDERMIQVQNTRFVYNWRKRSGDYPSFKKLLPEFEKRFDEFCMFLRKTGIGKVAPNQWELTYIDHVVQGPLWETLSDWKNISPMLCAPASVDDQLLDSFKADWHIVIGGSKGRLRVSAQHVRVTGPRGPEALALNFTARGPVEDDFREGFKLGHEHTVRLFTEMTSKEAHRVWKRSR